MTHRAFLTWFALGHLANDWPIASLWLILPAAGIALGLSTTEVGLLFTIFNIGGAIAYIPAGILCDHVSNRGRILTLTFWWVVFAYALATFASGFWSFAFLLGIAGMGNAAWHPIATGVLASYKKQTRARALGIHAMGGSFAEVLAPLFVGLLLSYLDWRGTLAASVLPTMLMGVCFFWVAPVVPRGEKRKIRQQEILEFFYAWRQGDGLHIIAMMCFYNMALIALLSMVPFYLATAYNLSPAAIGIAFALLLLAGALAQPWVGYISDTWGRRPVLVAGNLTAGIACTALIIELPFWIVVMVLAVAIAALDSIRAVMLSIPVDHTERSAGTALGLAFAIMDGIGAVGAVLAGIAAGISWQHMFGIAALFSFIAATIGFLIVFQSAQCEKVASNPKLFSIWLNRVRQRRNLRDSLIANPHLMEDIGMTRHELDAEISKRFWQS